MNFLPIPDKCRRFENETENSLVNLFECAPGSVDNGADRISVCASDFCVIR
jgi:hypothetical protein